MKSALGWRFAAICTGVALTIWLDTWSTWIAGHGDLSTEINPIFRGRNFSFMVAATWVEMIVFQILLTSGWYWRRHLYPPFCTSFGGFCRDCLVGRRFIWKGHRLETVALRKLAVFTLLMVPFCFAFQHVVQWEASCGVCAVAC